VLKVSTNGHASTLKRPITYLCPLELAPKTGLNDQSPPRRLIRTVQINQYPRPDMPSLSEQQLREPDSKYSSG